MDLAAVSSLPIGIAGNRLTFGPGMRAVEPAVRTLEDMRAYLADPAASGPAEVYYMYRGVTLEKDAAFWSREDLRYDITILVPGRIGGERVKTIGHYHPAPPGTQRTYAEVYQVLAGKASYLLQKRVDGKIADAVLVEAGPGDAVLIPPGYGHVTVNASDQPLVMANLVEAGFASLYGEFQSQRGAAYYCLADGSFRPNPNYAQVPELVRWEAVRLGESIYSLGRRQPEKFRFLVDPSLDGSLN